MNTDRFCTQESRLWCDDLTHSMGALFGMRSGLSSWWAVGIVSVRCLVPRSQSAIPWIWQSNQVRLKTVSETSDAC